MWTWVAVLSVLLGAGPSFAAPPQCELRIAAFDSPEHLRPELRHLYQETFPEAVLHRDGDTIFLYSEGQRERMAEAAQWYELGIDDVMINETAVHNSDLGQNNDRLVAFIALMAVATAGFQLTPPNIVLQSSVGVFVTCAAVAACALTRNVFRIFQRSTDAALAQDLSRRTVAYRVRHDLDHAVSVLSLPLERILPLRNRLADLGWESGADFYANERPEPSSTDIRPR